MNGSPGEAEPCRARLRLFVDAPLRPSETLALTAVQHHYLRQVMRVAAGTNLCLFNGRDGEWLARIDHLDRGGGAVSPLHCLRRQRSEPGPLLLFAPLKKDATDFVIEKATELGVSAVQPVFTRRTAAARVNLDRLKAQVIEAAEQCGRLTLPAIAPPRPLAEALAGWPAARRLFLAHPAAAPRDLAALFAAEAVGGSAGPPAFLIGPEGGFDEAELDHLGRLPFVSAVRLGPRILRAETAAVAVLACWQALAGDWRSADPASAREEQGK